MIQFHTTVKRVNAIKARQNLGKLLEEVYYQDDQFVIERAGKPMAAVIPLWQLKDWQKKRERLFVAVEEVHQAYQKVRPEKIERDVHDALLAVRTQTRRKK